jgi:nicotinate-nucleotide--dimethylbenzimidazole phosphoribosyltransferase
VPISSSPVAHFGWRHSLADRLTELLAAIRPADGAVLAETQRRFDQKTKPRRSLGRIEELGCRVAAVRGRVPAELTAAVVVAAADHGVAAEGVSAYPPEVTAQMLANFEAGGAAVCVLARQAGAQLVVVDAGVGAGTENIAAGPAMPRERAVAGLLEGAELAARLDVDVVALGEMGIGNTTSASALAAALLGVAPAAVCGRGTGLDDAGLAHKIAVVERALACNRPDPTDPLGVLAALGGFEIAFLAGLTLGAAAARTAVLVDGFISSTAALVAARLAPAALDAMIAAHLSPEPGHRLVLADLGLVPLLDLELRLGEGSGAALALPLLRSSVALLNEMAAFEDAGVTDTGH